MAVQESIKEISMKNVDLNLNRTFKRILTKFFLSISQSNLSATSIYQRKHISSLFLFYLQLNNILKISSLRRETIIKFIDEFKDYSKVTIKLYIFLLKVFLKFLYLNHYIKEPFYLTLPKIRVPKQSKIPSIWNAEDIQKILINIDRDSSIGKRDYAILVLIIKLGLRKIDIINLKFSDINWNNKAINIIQQKTQIPISLPLLDDVGWAVIDYIKNGRPQSNLSNIFFTHQKPISCFSSEHGNFYSIITKYMKKANIPITKNKKNGVHSLRHNLASEMLKKSTPIQVISSVLGHVNSNTTHYI